MNRVSHVRDSVLVLTTMAMASTSSAVAIGKTVEKLSNFQRSMTTKDEQCISTLGQSNVKSSSISKDILQIYHQNIEDIKWKTHEILDFFYPVFPHVMCLTEHHLNH